MLLIEVGPGNKATREIMSSNSLEVKFIIGIWKIVSNIAFPFKRGFHI
jgi:hypothetical protein